MSSINFKELNDIKYKEFNIEKLFLGDKLLWENILNLLNLTLKYTEFKYQQVNLFTGEWGIFHYSNISNLKNENSDLVLQKCRMNVAFYRPLKENNVVINFTYLDEIKILISSENRTITIKHIFRDDPLHSRLYSYYAIEDSKTHEIYETPKLEINLETKIVGSSKKDLFHEMFMKNIKIKVNTNNDIFEELSQFMVFFKDMNNSLTILPYNINIYEYSDIPTTNKEGFYLNLIHLKECVQYKSTELTLKVELDNTSTLISYFKTLGISEYNNITDNGIKSLEPSIIYPTKLDKLMFIPKIFNYFSISIEETTTPSNETDFVFDTYFNGDTSQIVKYSIQELETIGNNRIKHYVLYLDENKFANIYTGDDFKVDYLEKVKTVGVKYKGKLYNDKEILKLSDVSIFRLLYILEKTDEIFGDATQKGIIIKPSNTGLFRFSRPKVDLTLFEMYKIEDSNIITIGSSNYSMDIDNNSSVVPFAEYNMIFPEKNLYVKGIVIPYTNYYMYNYENDILEINNLQVNLHKRE